MINKNKIDRGIRNREKEMEKIKGKIGKGEDKVKKQPRIINARREGRGENEEEEEMG
jgi:hypothetical protein